MMKNVSRLEWGMIASTATLLIVIVLACIIPQNSNRVDTKDDVPIEYDNVQSSDTFDDLDHIEETVQVDYSELESADTLTNETVQEDSHPENTVQADQTDSSRYIDLTTEEIYQLATLVFLESGSEPFECQKAVASTIVNRCTVSGSSLYSVIYEKNQYSPAHLIPYYTPSESSLNAVMEVVNNGPSIPEYVTYFRASYYHDWSSRIIPYTSIGNTYFSYDNAIKLEVTGNEV